MDVPPAARASAASVGEWLLELRDVMQRAQCCRLALRDLGYSHQRWQEIVMDIDPDLRFTLRPQLLDAIISHLRDAGKPVNRNALARVLHMQEAGTLQRIRQAITHNLRSGNLLLLPGNKIGLPAWKDREQEGMAERD